MLVVYKFIGIDDQEDALQVNKQLANIEVNRDIFSILLYHRPVGLEACDDHGVDLMLSGHTHGGQIVPFNFFIRLGTRSEITLFEISN